MKGPVKESSQSQEKRGVKADVLVTGGTVVLPSSVCQDATIVIRDGRISEILQPDAFTPPATQTIDAREKIVFPGVVDAHVHVETPGPPTKPLGVYSDTFEDMTRAAMFGGVTTVIPFIFASETDDPAQYLRRFKESAERQAWTDFSFHFGIANELDVQAVPEVVKAGVRSFKALMAYKTQGNMISDKLLSAAMQEVGRWRGVMMVHAEDGELIDALEERAKAAGEVSPPDYARCRPAAAENMAILRAIELARDTGCFLYIVHLSTRDGLLTATQAREAGAAVIIETCPQYLLLSRDELRPDRLGPLAKIGPPLRETPHSQALWSAIRRGEIDVIGSDHAPRVKEDKLLGLENIFTAPFGSPGLETLLPVLYDAFQKRRLPLPTLARLLCEAPARVFGLFPRKGMIAVGADADLVILDPGVDWRVDPERLQTNAKYSVWADRPVAGRPITTMVRGKPVLLEGEASGGPGWGRFFPHDPVAY